MVIGAYPLARTKALIQWYSSEMRRAIGGVYGRTEGLASLLDVNYRPKRFWSAPERHSKPLTVRRRPPRFTQTCGCCCTSLPYINPFQGRIDQARDRWRCSRWLRLSTAQGG